MDWSIVRCDGTGETQIRKSRDPKIAAFVILVGAVLVMLKHEQAGSGLMMSGAAIFSQRS
jgi:hypothetical protein